MNLWKLLVHPCFCLCQNQMGSLSKKVPYPHNNFLLSTCQFMASNQGNGKFTEFVRLHGADSIPRNDQSYTLFHLFAKVFFAILLFCPFAKVFHYTVGCRFFQRSILLIYCYQHQIPCNRITTANTYTGVYCTLHVIDYPFFWQLFIVLSKVYDIPNKSSLGL